MFKKWVVNVFFIMIAAAAVSEPPSAEKPYALILPMQGTSKLKVSNEGISYLKSIPNEVAPIVVIGPYRSGKSFLLNQLLNVTCDKGFGVGHLRETQTKGVWIWGSPQLVDTNTGGKAALLYMDTEGFESTGRPNSYDDRIFALAVVMSSLLVYNLPEAIRESDLAKLSFSVDLADSLFDGEHESEDEGGIQPGNMLWLLQRDFLQGDSVQEAVDKLLQPVDNKMNDSSIEDLNKIRRSISQISKDSIGFGLKQPHLERTKLCELADGNLDEEYLRQRAELQELVQNSTSVKVLDGKPMMGKDLADLIIQVVAALNEREIPVSSSIVQSFNSNLAKKCLEQFRSHMEFLRLPIWERELENIKEIKKQQIIKLYNKKKYGSRGEALQEAEEIKRELNASLEREFESVKLNNTILSSQLCEAAENDCERALEKGGESRIPSKSRFQKQYESCLATFTAKCVGPAMEPQRQRLEKAWQREDLRFMKEYNDRLYLGLVVLSAADIILFRFILVSKLLEGSGWILLVFLEVYPRMGGSFESFYSTPMWKGVVNVWEFFTGNLLLNIFICSLALSFSCVMHRTCKKQREKRKSKILSDVERDLNV